MVLVINVGYIPIHLVILYISGGLYSKLCVKRIQSTAIHGRRSRWNLVVENEGCNT